MKYIDRRVNTILKGVRTKGFVTNRGNSNVLIYHPKYKHIIRFYLKWDSSVNESIGVYLNDSCDVRDWGAKVMLLWNTMEDAAFIMMVKTSFELRAKENRS